MAKFVIHGGDGVSCEVTDTTVTLYKERLTGRKQKVIPISQITGVDVKQPLPGWYSHMYFHVAGQRINNHFVGNVDDNRVQLQGAQYQTALQIQKHIASINSGANQKTNEGTYYSPSDEIRKLKQLADDGIISQEEFQEKKKELLKKM